MRQNGTNVPLSLEAQAQGYGDNTIVWVPQGIPTTAPSADSVYSVTVSNVLLSGQSRAFTYNVTIIDPDIPALSIRVASSNMMAITWPSSSVGYSLQQRASAVGSADWTNVSVIPQLISNNYAASISISPGQRYYRLTKP